MAGSEHAGVEFQLAGFMHGKLPERVHGMRRFCDDNALGCANRRALAVDESIHKDRILVTADDIPATSRPG